MDDAAVYEGTWNKTSNKFEGFGVRILADGSLYEGFFLDGLYINRGRSINAADSDVYDGDFVLGLKCGQGTLTTLEGTVYIGSWS